MKRWDRFDEDDGAWRQLLPRWTADGAPPALERALRREFRRRRRNALLARWGTWAAAVALAVSGILALVRLDDTRRSRRPGSAGPGEVRVTIVGDQVRTDVDLTGFQPVRQPRLTRMQEATSETSLEGFVPVHTLRLTRWDESEGERR